MTMDGADPECVRVQSRYVLFLLSSPFWSIPFVSFAFRSSCPISQLAPFALLSARIRPGVEMRTLAAHCPHALPPLDLYPTIDAANGNKSWSVSFLISLSQILSSTPYT